MSSPPHDRPRAAHRRHRSRVSPDVPENPPSPPLCQDCAKIPFEELEHREASQRRRFRIGTIPDIINSLCPFCQLVAQVISWCLKGPKEVNEKVTDLLDNDRVIGVDWSLGSPSGRSGFTLAFETGEMPVWLTYGSDRTQQAPQDGEFSCLLETLPGQLNVQRISKWIGHCTARHQRCVLFPNEMLFNEAFPGLDVLRFIDVIGNCLVEKREPVQYVALSYVWGSVTNFRLTKANRAEMMKPGALKRLSPLLPKTISDSITLVRKLGMRFLWVDALCLLQNDQVDLELGVGVMDQIYEHAWFTIVAASGHDANAGLPGVQLGSRMERSLVNEVKPGTFVGVHMVPVNLLPRTIYETRAWTFQEHVISRRLLYFFENEVIFSCRETDCWETCRNDRKLRRPGGSGPEISLASQLKNPLWDYETIVRHFTSRFLTNDSDVLRAMAGIIRRVSRKLGYDMLAGLPIGAFDAFILFRGDNSRRRPDFPSYSWAGWRGEIWVSRNLTNRLRDRTWIIWYLRYPDANSSLLWDSDEKEPHDVDGISQIYTTPLRGLPISGIDVSQTKPTILPPRNQRFPGPFPILQFWTLVLFLRLKVVDVFRPQGEIFGRDGVRQGDITLDGFEETTFFDSDQPFEMVLLSESEDYRRDSRFFNVMLIEWVDKVAERRGLGTVSRAAVEQSFAPGPLWKEICLA
ncbi:hypothetical protein OQA88_8768 [Cercophora sp. LCS_1]